ncbi:splicing factor Cactin [Amyelois transitella]|uniref:splicing factor Cactin n=1 Tax=Amyelois transitella TaxID=680683 RepID=UPI00067D7864|nr:splicing factor Cactin [Amyelois transitella]
MSSRSEISKRRDRSKSRSLDRYRDRKGRSKDRKSRSHSPERSKHRSMSREKKKDKHEKHKKSKKKKKRHSSSSSSSSEDSDEEELKLLQRLEAERLRLKEERRKEKEAQKANETPEEKRARRLKEKQEKERRRRERMGWDNEYQCYTNQDNPFGDSALTNTFVWTKKLAKEGVKSVSRDELEALNRQKQLENKIELEKVKQRRLEREAERAAREAEAAAAARAREAQQFSSWARQEDAFHLQQARLRSQIRIRDGRAKPIDLLAWYVSSEECVDALEMHEPYTYLNGLQAQDLEDLLEDIKVYKELEKAGNQPYWEDVQTIVLDELGKLRREAAPLRARDGVHRAVAADVTQIFKGKTGEQLEALQTQIEQKISGRRDGVDIGYWESLLSQLKAHMSRARLRARHQHNLRRKLRLLKLQQGVAPPAQPAHQHEPEPSTSQPAAAAEGSGSGGSDEESAATCEALYEAGRYSPPLLAAAGLEPGTLLASPGDDERRVALFRAALHAANASKQHADFLAANPSPEPAAAPASSAALESLARRSIPQAAEHAPFGAELALPDQPCLWADKYRPRKPRYFNRVHTGFEWNKYNQTHYDMDNPPPKIVQGYKFNIFYPDLIDKNATPEFSLKPCPENPDFAVLRFHAGPPYEDIAFKIVNREWEYSYKRGFRCHFHNNIFQLWFHFKRYRYRR